VRAVCNLSVCRRVNKQYKHNLSYTMHNHQRLYRRKPSIGILPRVAKHLLQMPQSPTSLQMDTVSVSISPSWKIFTRNAIITDISTECYCLSVFYRELQNIYCKCDNHWRLYRRIQSIGICWRSSQLPTESPTDDENLKGWVLMHLWACVIVDILQKFWRVI
jgi:hypothetical protein